MQISSMKQHLCHRDLTQLNKNMECHFWAEGFDGPALKHDQEALSQQKAELKPNYPLIVRLIAKLSPALQSMALDELEQSDSDKE